ncbi:hypothetical protein QJS10_CPA01g00617 [Acorus calamus]|uniref:Uncharacterized protein n=1 Tax=Acorus calamus TaxID=4465 RepID=A0AAV9FKX5_ACOCL|nr:hypothetical protein QJS10_CPA01g00617 [Acorus calamus]
MFMGLKNKRKGGQKVWCAAAAASPPPPLAPLMEGPDPEAQGGEGKRGRSWDLIRSWVAHGGVNSFGLNASRASKRLDLKLMIGVLGCPLAPVPLEKDPVHHLSIKGIPIETSSARYIIQQYLAATGCLKLQKCIKSFYATGTMRMACCETELQSGKGMKSFGSSRGSGGGDNGCFVLWQMAPDMWSIELAVAGFKVVAGSDGKTVWRHTPWLGTHAAKGPQRPLRRLIQGLDPKSTASLFTKAQCLGEKRIGADDCFVLRVAADRAAVAERSDGPAEVIRHVLHGYFSQRSGLLVYLEDSHLTRVQTSGSADTLYWETTIGTTIEDYREVDGLLISHHGQSVATVLRFGEESVVRQSRTRMEEVWRIDDVVFNVPGLSADYFIPPADVLDAVNLGGSR